MHQTIEEQNLDKSLRDDVERQKAAAQAEVYWTLCFPDKANLWLGATDRLKTAQDALATYEERKRCKEFEWIVHRYEDALAELCRHADTPERLRAIMDEQRPLNGYGLAVAGVRIRTGVPVPGSEDERQREDFAKWQRLEQERIGLSNACDQAHARRATMELEHPWLREYGKILDSKAA